MGGRRGAGEARGGREWEGLEIPAQTKPNRAKGGGGGKGGWGRDGVCAEVVRSGCGAYQCIRRRRWG